MEFREVVVHAADLDALEQFYGLTLGLPVRRDSGLSVQIGSTRLHWRLGSSSPYHLAFNMPENHFEQALAWLEPRVTLLPLAEGKVVAEFPSWRARSCYFYDPAGNLLECIVRSNLELQSRLPFGVSSWQCVSEVGLVVEDVLAAADSLQRTLGVPVFDGKDNPSFCALGDDRGLLILVKSGRIWYPTENLAAQASPLQLELGQHRLEHPPLQVQRSWRPGELVSLNGQTGVILRSADRPDDHEAIWFGETSGAWTVPGEYLKSAPLPPLQH